MSLEMSASLAARKGMRHFSGSVVERRVGASFTIRRRSSRIADKGLLIKQSNMVLLQKNLGVTELSMRIADILPLKYSSPILTPRVRMIRIRVGQGAAYRLLLMVVGYCLSLQWAFHFCKGKTEDISARGIGSVTLELPLLAGVNLIPFLSVICSS